jgi:hypothetical protein
MPMFIPAGRSWSVWLRPRGEGFSRNQRINPMQARVQTIWALLAMASIVGGLRLAYAQQEQRSMLMFSLRQRASAE